MADLKPCRICEGRGLPENTADIESAAIENDWIECAECGETETYARWQAAEPSDTPMRRERDALRAEVAALKAGAVDVFWSDDDQMWVARLSDNHGVSGLGTTRAWALRQLSDAVALLDKGGVT